MKFRLKVRPGAMTFVMWAIFVFAILELLNVLGVVSLSSSPLFFPTVIGLFLLLDQGVISAKKGVAKPTSVLGWLLTIFGILILFGVALSALSISVGYTIATLLTWVKAGTAFALLLSLIME